MRMNTAGIATHPRDCVVLYVFFLARRWIEDDVVDRLNQLDLHERFDREDLKQSEVRGGF